ncbi:MAG: glycosyltransferase family 4 protein [Chloroflexota bacterium]
MKVALVSSSIARTTSGLGRYDRALLREFEWAPELGVHAELVASAGVSIWGAGLVKRRAGVDISRFLQTYPVGLVAGRADVLHLTSQTLASALWRAPRLPVVVTVHDIFPYVHRDDPQLTTYGHTPHRWFDAWAMRHLHRASALITDCRAVADDLEVTLNIAHGAIHVIPLGFERSLFRPLHAPPSFWSRYGLDPQRKYVLHVSSEEPRKNLTRLVRAWPRVVHQTPDAVLLKVGTSHYPRQRTQLLQLVQALRIADSVRIVEVVPDADLVHFYNAAAAFAFPSIAEGFGFPVLEAMACGTPIVCSDIPALHELTGDAAIRVNPVDIDALAQAIVRVLGDAPLRAALRERGLERAEQFAWRRTAAATAEVYRTVLSSAGPGSSPDEKMPEASLEQCGPC